MYVCGGCCGLGVGVGVLLNVLLLCLVTFIWHGDNLVGEERAGRFYVIVLLRVYYPSKLVYFPLDVIAMF